MVVLDKWVILLYYVYMDIKKFLGKKFYNSKRERLLDTVLHIENGDIVTFYKRSDISFDVLFFSQEEFLEEEKDLVEVESGVVLV